MSKRIHVVVDSCSKCPYCHFEIDRDGGESYECHNEIYEDTSRWPIIASDWPLPPKAMNWDTKLSRIADFCPLPEADGIATEVTNLKREMGYERP